MKETLLIHLCGIGCLLAAGLATDLHAATGNFEDTQAVERTDRQYEEAFNRGDAASIAALYDENAVYVSDEGEELHGRKQIEDRLKQQFGDNVPEKLTLKVESINIPSNDLAVERGTAIVTREGESSESRYRAEYVHKDNQWLLSKVEEQGVSEAEQHLRDLAWLAGQWEDKSENTSIQFDVNWDLGRSFLKRQFNVITEGRQEYHGMELIGWDAGRQQIRSWYFDSNGGFGSGEWTHEGDKWVIKAHGTRPDGKPASSTMIIVPQGDNSYLFTSTDRVIGGEAQPQVGPYAIYRKSAPSATTRATPRPEQQANPTTTTTSPTGTTAPAPSAR